MKKIIFSVALAGLIFSACSDAYEIEQPGVVTEEGDVFRTPADIEKGIRAVYGLFPGETEIAFTSFFTDELGVGIHNSGQGVNDGSYTFLLQAGDGEVQSIWGSYYGVINRLNRIEARIIEMENTATSAELTALKSHKAHLYGLRAFCNYKLFAYFTPDYTNPNGLSIIKFDFLQTDDYNRFEKRATVAEIVAFIESDIQKARNLGGIKPAGDVTAYASMPFLEAIEIKLYSMTQTANGFVKMEEAFNRLINPPVPNPSDPNGINIDPKSLNYYEYLTLFAATPSDMAEGIFKLNRTSTDGASTSGVASAWYANKVDRAASAAYPTGATVYMEMGRSLYNELDKLDPSLQGQDMSAGSRRDARFTTTVYGESVVNPNYASLNTDDFIRTDILLIGKYTGITNRPLMNNIWVFRFADMLLALAEKRAYEGNYSGNVAINDFSNVESIIYNIRANRTESLEPVVMPTDFSSQQAAYARILEERRVEFAFEGHRYLDMKRLGVKAGSPGFVRDAQDCASTNACLLEVTSTRLTLPIPRSEMVANPNVVQNPGY